MTRPSTLSRSNDSLWWLFKTGTETRCRSRVSLATRNEY